MKIAFIMFMITCTYNLNCQDSASIAKKNDEKRVYEDIRRMKKIGSDYEGSLRKHERLLNDTLPDSCFKLGKFKIGMPLDSVRAWLGIPLQRDSFNTAFEEPVWVWYYKDAMFQGFRNKLISITSASNSFEIPNGIKVGLRAKEVSTVLGKKIKKGYDGVITLFCQECPPYFHLILINGQIESIWLRYPD